MKSPSRARKSAQPSSRRTLSRLAIVAGHQQLANSLAEAGLTLTGLSVDVSGGEQNSDQQKKDRASGFGRRYTVHELSGAAADSGASDQLSGPQLISSSSLELFNYLA